MSQRTLNLTQNNIFQNAVHQRVHSGLTNLDTKKTRKANYDFGRNNTWKRILRGKLLRHKISQDETQVFRTMQIPYFCDFRQYKEASNLLMINS